MDTCIMDTCIIDTCIRDTCIMDTWIIDSGIITDLFIIGGKGGVSQLCVGHTASGAKDEVKRPEGPPPRSRGP